MRHRSQACASSRSFHSMAEVALGRTAEQTNHERVVELAGAGLLSFRIAQQENWAQAEAVGEGRQSRIDPDGNELEAFSEGLRIYRPHEVGGTMDGRPAILSQRLVKRLANGVWESDVEVVSYRYASGPFSRR
jgi:hypothetical protein